MRKLLLVGVGICAAACGIGTYVWSPEPGAATYGVVRSEADAIAAARMLTGLESPITVVAEPRRGRAADLYTGVYGSATADDPQRVNELAARRERTAWRVDVTGLAPAECGAPSCPIVTWTEELIIDETTGSELYSLMAPGRLP
jgi:hypothetical protein